MSRKMKDSCVPWVGDIPEKWSAQSVKNLVEPGKNGIKIGPFGSALKGKTLDAGPVKIYNQANLISEDFDVSRHFVSEETFKELSAYHVFPGDILFSMMGTIGKCCQMPANKQVGIMDSHLLKARLNSKILPEFFIYAFDKDRNPSTFDQLMLLSKGSIMNGLNSEIVRKVKIAVPPINEQHAIVSYLDSHCATIDSAISKHQQIIEKLEEYRKAVITQAVTKGLNPNAKMDDDHHEGLGAIPTHWKYERIKYLFTIRKRIAGEEGYTVLSITQHGIVPKDIDSNKGQIAADYSDYQLVYAGDFAMNHMDLLTGWVDISNYDGVTSPDYRVFTINDETRNDKRYFKYLLQMCYFNRIFYRLGAGISGMGRWRLQAPAFNNFKFPVPPLAEQAEIANYIDHVSETIDTAVSQHNQLISKLQEYKQSLIYNAVTGKIDCTVEAKA